MTPELWTGIAIGVCGFAWFLVFILGLEAFVRHYGQVAGPPNERMPPHAGWSDDVEAPK